MSCIYNSELFEIMNIFQILQKMSLVPSYLWDKMWVPVWKRCMKHCGKGVYIRPMSSDIKGLWNLSVGDGTSIPKGSTIYCTDAPCTIGKKVLFGPKPTIITGDHRIDILGKYMTDIGGIPAKLLKMRFTDEEIMEHERMLDVKCVK